MSPPAILIQSLVPIEISTVLGEILLDQHGSKVVFHESHAEAVRAAIVAKAKSIRAQPAP